MSELQTCKVCRTRAHINLFDANKTLMDIQETAYMQVGNEGKFAGEISTRHLFESHPSPRATDYSKHRKQP